MPRTATVRDEDALVAAVRKARQAQELTTLVAKVEERGPQVYLTDLHMLENRFEFQRWLRARAGEKTTD